MVSGMVGVGWVALTWRATLRTLRRGPPLCQPMLVPPGAHRLVFTR